MLNTPKIRREFPFLTRIIDLRARDGDGEGRIFLDSPASTQMPMPVLESVAKSSFYYANVHRGEYNASQRTTESFERAYNIAANLVNADSWREIIMGRNTTEMINLVARGIGSQFRDGDNIVTTRMEHNSNYVPWFALSQDAARCDRKVEVRVVDFGKKTGELDMNQLARNVDQRTKIVCCTGASNFLGTKPDIKKIGEIAHSSKYSQPDGSQGSYFLVDGAQLVPGSPVDVKEIGCDFLAWSFHKMMVPLGVGALYGRKEALEQMDPFIYGGDMVEDVAEGEVTYKPLPWKFTAGTPNILGTIAAARGINFLMAMGRGNIGDNQDYRILGRQIVDEILMNTVRGDFPYKFNVPVEFHETFARYLEENPGVYETLQNPKARLAESRALVKKAMTNIMDHEQALTNIALETIARSPNVTIYGPRQADRRTGLVAFNIKDLGPNEAAKQFNRRNIEFRHGTLCASLAHKFYGINGSVRMGLYAYNTPEEVESAASAIYDVSRGAR